MNKNELYVLSNKKMRKALFSALKSNGCDISIAIADIPFPIGSCIAGAIHSSIAINNYLFFRKLEKFLFPLEKSDIKDEDINTFLDKIGDSGEKVAIYLYNLLSNSENEDKTLIMGYIYKSAILRKIDYIMMLRLCSIVRNAFLPDLKKLPLYFKSNDEGSIESSNFINLGLIDNFVGGIWIDKPRWELNEVGKILYGILDGEDWFFDK
jgi:hypothetical protein